jgi:hypothetical protein
MHPIFIEVFVIPAHGAQFHPGRSPELMAATLTDSIALALMALSRLRIGRSPSSVRMHELDRLAAMFTFRDFSHLNLLEL